MTRDEIEHWVRSCLRKARYSNSHKAEVGRSRCQRQRPDTALRIYPCDYCYGWHLTKVAANPERIES
ncbi:hypothetical protein ED208_12605 [Stagnimonas aquatica]|uniref:Uncharacterized protein n=1 Tax=Stagnimonas aquatica TaxID=2689987 RepID=A0A3N0V7F6_9GAMM|nr:hypothetical protein [Stagnimonas aquatica]ROH88653.1 hypothetical protein ED208_12605 [Stagnimonas aquatica]